MLFLPSDTEYIIETLQKNGYEAFAVGGCVRDMLNGDTPHDFDITTSAEPETVMSLFEKTVPTGIKHGTVTVIINGVPNEVTTYQDRRRIPRPPPPRQRNFCKEPARRPCPP